MGHGWLGSTRMPWTLVLLQCEQPRMNCVPFVVQAVRDTHSKLTLAISLYVYKPSLLVECSFLFIFSTGTFHSLAPRWLWLPAGWLVLPISEQPGKSQATEQGMLASRKLGGSWPGDLGRGNKILLRLLLPGVTVIMPTEILKCG